MISFMELAGFAIVKDNNKAVQSIQDTLLYNAEKQLDNALHKNPDNPVLNYNHGLVKLRQFEEGGDDKTGLESAVKSFEKAKADTTKSHLQASYYNQANAYYYLEDYANAILNYQESGTYLDSTNIDPDLLYNYANSLYKYAEANPEQDSLFALAQTVFKNTSGMVDSSHKQRIWHNMGNISFKQGNYQEAISYYIESLRLDPDSEDTRINYEIALRKLAEQQQQQQQQDKQKQEQQEDKSEQEKSQEQQDEQQKQEEQAKEKQEQYDKLSEEEKEKLEAQKKLDALLQEQSRPDEEKPKELPQRPTGRYW